MRERIIKYLLNFTGLSLMIFYANLGYGIIARIPECEYVKSTIWSVVGELSMQQCVVMVRGVAMSPDHGFSVGTIGTDLK